MSAEFDLASAIGLTEATRLIRGKRGGRPAVETIRRWANPRRGCFPAGKDGPRLVLKTAKVNGEVLTTKVWVEEFERERARLGERKSA